MTTAGGAGSNASPAVPSQGRADSSREDAAAIVTPPCQCCKLTFTSPGALRQGAQELFNSFPRGTRDETWWRGTHAAPELLLGADDERESYRLGQTGAGDAERAGQKACRPDSARASVSSSAYSRSPPTGRP